jgi:CRISPR-associated protein Csm3
MGGNKMSETIKLTKKVTIEGKIRLLTGMLIGGTDTGIEIGGIDKTVVRNPLNNQPYIPGSSLKGKMRSLLEKDMGLELTALPGSEKIRIHRCDKNSASLCILCKVFGVPAEFTGKRGDTRLIVRDAELAGFVKEDGSIGTIKELEENKNISLPYTELKTEVVIDRITSQAMPRTFERVPANVLFNLKLVCNVFENDNEQEILNLVIKGLKLLQDDYIGGQGSRGYGQVKISIEKIENSEIQIPEELKAKK